MVKRVFLSVLNIAFLVMCIVAAVYRWYVAGIILLILAAAWFAITTFVFCRKVSLYGLVAPILLVVFGFGIWTPLALVGFEVAAYEIFVVIGAMCALFTIPFNFISYKK